MKKEIQVFLIILVISFSEETRVFGQSNPIFSTPFINQQVYNPSRSGLNREFNEFTLFHRGSYLGYQSDFDPSSNYFQTTSLTANVPLVKKNLGIGAVLLTDQLASVDRFQAIGQLSYMAKLRRGLLSFGLGLGAELWTLNFDRDDFVDPNDPVVDLLDNSQGSLQQTRPKIQAGFTYLTNKLFASYSVLLTGYSAIESDLLQEHFVDLGYNIFLGIDHMITPRMLVRSNLGTTTLQYGLEVSLFDNRISLGSYFRNTNTQTTMFGYSMNRNRTIDLFISTDLALGSRVRNATEAASVEVMLRFKTKALHLSKANPVRTPRYKFE